MKAIKIASGFAVTALAVAISGQAAAADVEFSSTGEINVQSFFDLENDARTNFIEDEYDGDNDKFELSITTTVTDGPFSGKLKVREAETTTTESDYKSVDIYIDDLIVTEGAIAFGQISSANNTDDLLDTVTDGDNEGLSYSVDGGLSYTMGNMIVQAEADYTHAAGVNTPVNRFGAGFAMTQDLGMGTLYVDAQYAEDAANVGKDVFVGVGAELMPTEELKVTAVYQMAASSAYGVRADYTMGDMSVYASYGEVNADVADDEVIILGGSMTADMLTFSAEYAMRTDADQSLELDADYANGAISANAGYTMNLATANETSKIDLSVKYTSESGVAYSAAYDNDTAADGTTVTKNGVTLKAAYSF